MFHVKYIICVVSYDYKETNTVFLIADTSSSYNYLLLTSPFLSESYEILLPSGFLQSFSSSSGVPINLSDND